MPIDTLTIDTDCIDGVGCAPLAGTYSAITAWTPQRGASTNVLVHTPPTPAVNAP